MTPGAVPVFRERIAWNVTCEGDELAPCTRFHSMISRSLTPSPVVSSYLPSSMALPLLLTQSSHSTAMARWLGALVRLVLLAELLLLPNVISPFVLTNRRVYV